jgi:hypothetical protein
LPRPTPLRSSQVPATNVDGERGEYAEEEDEASDKFVPSHLDDEPGNNEHEGARESRDSLAPVDLVLRRAGSERVTAPIGTNENPSTAAIHPLTRSGDHFPTSCHRQYVGEGHCSVRGMTAEQMWSEAPPMKTRMLTPMKSWAVRLAGLAQEVGVAGPVRSHGVAVVSRLDAEVPLWRRSRGLGRWRGARSG